ncbi:hypothetical protein J3R83DRAFT_8376 [Lanmaoa asiatica]|nr:hypothetical protein J3R83DRAFT_8376 [Lanmaoa asiatica]
MHPYQHVFLHRGPSRIFWFLIGAGVATCWHHSSSIRDHRAQYFPCVRRVQDSPTSWRQQRDWEQDGERLKHLQKRAGETVADLSESTLDSIVAGAESLKAKLIQLRTEREHLEAEKKSLLRLHKQLYRSHHP